MSYFETIQSGGDQRLDPVAPASFAGMRPNGQCSRFVRDCDRIFDRKALLRDKRTRSSPQISHECVVKVVHYAARDQCTRDVRTADCPAIGLLKNFVQRERNSNDVELVHDLLCACVAQRTQLAEPLFQSLQLGEVQRQDVDFVLVKECTELHSCDYSNSKSGAGRPRRLDSPDSIMVSERQRGETAPLRGFDDLLGGKNAVRCGRMGMQVDERRPAPRRIRAHCS